MLTRRDLGRLALAGMPRAAAFLSLGNVNWRAMAQRTAEVNRSYVNGVQFGLQPFCYHDLAMTPENRGTLVRRLVQNGFGTVELHATWVEPRFTGGGVSAPEARAKLRAWRLSQPVEHYQSVRNEFDAAGI